MELQINKSITKSCYIIWHRVDYDQVTMEDSNFIWLDTSDCFYRSLSVSDRAGIAHLWNNLSDDKLKERYVHVMEIEIFRSSQRYVMVRQTNKQERADTPSEHCGHLW